MITAQSIEKHRYVTPTKWWISIILILYAARDLGRIGIPDVLFTAVIGLAFITLPIEDGLAVFMFTSALTLPGNEIRLLYIFSLFLKKGNKTIFPGVEGIALLGMLSLQLIDMYIYSKGGLGSITYSYITYSLYFI